jgi:hypothetical protein
VLVTLARLIAIAAPMFVPDGGARAAVAVPSAFAFASVLAEDEIVSEAASICVPVGSTALEVVFAMFTEIAAATLMAPPEDCAGGAAGSEAEPGTLLLPASVLPKVRLPLTCESGDGAPEPLGGEPSALALAVVVVVDDPAAISSTVPDVVMEPPPLAETAWFANPSASDAPTAVLAPLASPVAVVVTSEASVACALKLPLRLSVTPLSTPAVVEKFETVRPTTGVTAVPPAAPPVAVVLRVLALADESERSPAVTLAPRPTLASVVALAI